MHFYSYYITLGQKEIFISFLIFLKIDDDYVLKLESQQQSTTFKALFKTEMKSFQDELTNGFLKVFGYVYSTTRILKVLQSNCIMHILHVESVQKKVDYNIPTYVD